MINGYKVVSGFAARSSLFAIRINYSNVHHVRKHNSGLQSYNIK
jgi:hypothetical protein